jgi:hemoglobin
MAQSIYDKYGGYNTIYNIIFELYQELCDHPEIAIHFLGVDIDRLIRLQTQFVSKALGAEIEYKGRPLRRAHHDLDITGFQYKEVEKIFTALFKKHGFSEEDVEAVKGLLKAERGKIVTAKWSLIDMIVKPFYFVVNYFENILRQRGALEED